MTIHVEDVRIKPILSSLRKRIPVTEGYVEVKDGGKWKQICDEEWSPMNSRVTCGMFGFPAEKKYNTRVYKSVCSAFSQVVNPVFKYSYPGRSCSAREE